MSDIDKYRPIEDAQKAREYLGQMCKGERPSMSIPVQHDDWDMVFMRLIRRCEEIDRVDLVPQCPEWLPIESAPRDKRVLVWSGQEIYAVHWSKNPMTDDEAWIVAEWGTDGDQALVKALFWMPLPAAPKPPAGGDV